MSFKWKLAQWLELHWWKHYFAGKDKGAYYHWKRNYWNQLLSTISDVVKLHPNDSVAEVGCGPAGIFVALQAKDVIAIDPLLEQYESTLPFFKKADFPNVKFVNSPIESYSASKRFHKVFCMNAINHVSDIQSAFDVLENITAENGQLIVSIDAHNFKAFKILFRLIPGDALHPHQYDLAEYCQFLESRGFQVSRIEKLKAEFFFNHYVLVANRINPQSHQ
ncbi:MAG: methyltransferase domain-containing protein [Chitinophagales bacterium]